MKNERGIGMIELMIVVAILGVLIFVLQDSYSRWAARYRVENAVKTLHAHMTAARGRAMARSRAHFLRIDGAASYEVVEDTSPAPDGNGALDDTDARIVGDSADPYGITLVLGGSADNTLVFSRDGMALTDSGANASGYIRLASPVGADYDCIDIVPTRLKPGLFNVPADTCVAR